jgi:hypothetical protein
MMFIFCKKSVKNETKFVSKTFELLLFSLSSIDIHFGTPPNAFPFVTNVIHSSILKLIYIPVLCTFQLFYYTPIFTSITFSITSIKITLF